MTTENNKLPFDPCPPTPNCHIECVKLRHNADYNYKLIEQIIKQFRVYSLQSNPERKSLHAVFRIPVFGFKDDVKIVVEPLEPNQSYLYIKSSSRVGYSDLGVNRRRVKRILNRIQHKIKH